MECLTHTICTHTKGGKKRERMCSALPHRWNQLREMGG